MNRESIRLPMLPGFILRLFLPKEDYRETVFDLEEVYCDIAGRSPLRAWFWLFFQAVLAVVHCRHERAVWGTTLLANSIKISVRHIAKRKGRSFINIAGLAIGTACAFFITIWIWDEIRYDSFHEHIDSICLLGTVINPGIDNQFNIGSPPALGPVLKEEYPEIVDAARLHNSIETFAVSYGDVSYYEDFRFVDPSFFSIMTFPLIKGSRENFQKDRHSLFLSEKKAHKYFGTDDPVGKTVILNGTYGFSVAGVLKSFPENSSISFDFVVPLSFKEELRGKGYLASWNNLSFRTFLQLRPGTDFTKLERGIAGIILRQNKDNNLKTTVHPFSRLHLYGYSGEGGAIGRVRLFILVAVLILLIAGINFVNIAIAQADTRRRETGIRKASGAQRSGLIRYYLTESFLFSYLAFATAIILVVIVLPFFNGITGKDISLHQVAASILPLLFFGIATLTGFCAGLYPALFLSSFTPVQALKAASGSGNRKKFFRKFLVIAQFSISIALCIGAVTVNRQYRYMINKDIGIKKEQIIYMPLNGQTKENMAPLKKELLKYPDVIAVSSASHLITRVYWNNDSWEWQGKSPEINPLITNMSVDQDFKNVFSIENSSGGFFGIDNSSSGKIVINNTMADLMHYSPSGNNVLFRHGKSYEIIGVVRDFHFTPLFNAISPMIMYCNIPGRHRYLYVKISPNDIQNTLAQIKKVFLTVNPDTPFMSRFLDSEIEQNYHAVQASARSLSIFTVIAILISGIGLFGLSDLLIQSRIKEIGIRKVLGASTGSISAKFITEFALLAVTANVLAWPAAYFFSLSFLNDYYYRIPLQMDIFLYSGLLALSIAVFTVFFRSFKAAVVNPVHSLKCE